MKIPKLLINTHGIDGNVLVTVDPPIRESRGNVDVVCVIDVSGSMQVEASMKDEKGDVETHGLSILDVVKHSVKTIIKSMKKDDRLSIVTFSTEAKIIFDLIPMGDRGRKRALRELIKLEVETQTNLWDGLFQGMEVARKVKKCVNKSHVILFTDGLPNVVPPRGHLEMLEQYQEKHHQTNRPTLHFVGFGYSLDSQLLEELALKGHGIYSYIPDSSFVGTIFVNLMANIFSTLTSHPVLSLEAINGATITSVLGEYEMEESGEEDEDESNNQVVLHPGTIRYGSRKDLIVKMNLPEEKEIPYLRCKLSYPTPNKEDHQLTEIIVESGSWDGTVKEIDVQVIRLLTVENLRKAIHFARTKNDLKGAQAFVDEMLKRIDESRVKRNKSVQGIAKDLNGQVTLSLSRREWFDRWGNHYLRSLLAAHAGQYCNNFKDIGVQIYGKNKLFQKLRDEGEEIFSKMPPPKPAPQKNPFEGTAMSNLWQPQQQPKPQRNFSMRRYYNVGGGCIEGECNVKMFNSSGSYKNVKDVRKGDVVMSSAGTASTVICVVKTECTSGKMKMCRLDSGLTLTPYHPVRVDGLWKFPNQLVEEKEVSLDAVYDFVLDKNHSMIIDGLEVVTFGHGFKGSSVVEHEYFGSKKIIQDLEKFDGWKNGIITLKEGAMKRDKVSNKVIGLDESFEVC